MQTIKKLLGQLVFKPKGIQFDVEPTDRLKSGIPDEITKDWFNLTVYVDSEKYHKFSDKYDEQYYNSFSYLDDSVYPALNYIQKSNDLRRTEYKHVNTDFIFNELKNKLDDKMKEYLLKASKETNSKYKGEVEIFFDKFQPYPTILLTNDMPKEYSDSLWVDVVDTYDLDDFYITTNDYDED